MGNGHSSINGANRSAAASVGLHSFRHLAQGDVPAWLAFLEAHRWLARRCRYDVELGVGAAVSTAGGLLVPAPYARLLKKRVDVVVGCWWGFVAIEVKPIAGAGALGQAAMYRQLLREQTAADCEVGGCVVAATLDRDCLTTFAAAGLAVWVSGSGWVTPEPAWARRAVAE